MVSTSLLRHRRHSVLGGIRTASLGCAPTLAMVALWQSHRNARDMTMPPGWLTSAVRPLLLGWLVLVVALLLRHRYRLPRLPTALVRLSVAATGLASLAAGGFFGYLWLMQAMMTGMSVGHALTLTAALLALALAATSDLLLSRTGHSPRPEGPKGSRTRPPRLWAASAAITTAVLVGTALAPAQFLNPVSSTRMPTPGTTPDLLSQVTGEVVWSRTASPAADVVAGTTGPVMQTGSRVEALDPHDGSALWSYEHHGARFTGVGEDSDPRVIATPDRRHVLVSVEMPNPKGLRGRQVTVLDSTTGAVVAQRDITFEFPGGVVQVTNSVALINHEGVSLEDGSTLWSLPRTVDSRFSGPAAPHTLILDQKCDGRKNACVLTLAEDSDPTSVRTLSDVVPDPHDSTIPGYGDDVVTVAQGWTVRRSDPGSQHSPLEAISLDAAGTNAQEQQEVVPLGAYSGPDRATSSSRIALRPAGPATPPGSDDSAGSSASGGSSASPPSPSAPASGEDPDPYDPKVAAEPPPLPVAVFDPSTRSLSPVSVSGGWDTSALRPSWPTPDTTAPRWVTPAQADAPARLELGRADGRPPVTIDTAEDLLQRHETADSPFALGAPGVVVVGTRVSTDTISTRMGATKDRSRTVLYGLR